MKQLGAALKVGILVLLVVILGFYSWKSVSERASGVGGYKLSGKFRDASGLAGKSRVVIAGLTIGEIAERKLEGRFARVIVKIRKGTEIWSNAAMYKKSSSLLGEYYLEIDPGTPETVLADGSVQKNRLLQPGEEIPNVIEATTPEELMRRVSDTLPRVDEVLVEVRGLVADTRRIVNGPVASMADKLDNELARDAELVNTILARTDRTLASVEVIARDIRKVTGNADERVDRIFDNLDTAAGDAKAFIAEARQELAATGDAVRQKLDRIDATLIAIEETVGHSASIAKKIDEDEGTLGRLVNDPAIADNIEMITTDAKEFTHTMFGLQTIVGLRSEYNYYANAWKTYFSVELQTRPEKFYLVEIVSDPRGSFESSYQAQTPGEFEETITVSQDYRFTFQFGRRIDWLTLRFGIKESTGGLGADADFRNLHLSADLFDASFDDLPRLKLMAAYQFFRYLYVVGGIDDVLNEHEDIDITPTDLAVPGRPGSSYHFGRDYYVGAMIKFNDADLAALLFIGGSALAGIGSQ